MAENTSPRTEPVRSGLTAEQEQRLYELTRRVDKGDKQARRELKEFVHAHWLEIEKLASHATQVGHDILHRTFSPSMRAVVRAQIDRLRAELDYDGSPMDERLLVDQIALNLIHYKEIAAYHAGHLADTPSQKLARFWDQRLAEAQRRLNRSIEALARVRKLHGRPDVQVNIAACGGQQVVDNGR